VLYTGAEQWYHAEEFAIIVSSRALEKCGELNAGYWANEARKV
jgi:hypothetical protein